MQIPAYDLLILRLSTGLEVGDLVVAETLPEIKAFLEQAGYPFEVWECAPELADTATFCEHYDVLLENSANAILVKSKNR